MNNKSTLRPWVGEDFANLDLCQPGHSLYAPVARCWGGWNKAEVLSGGHELLPLGLCVPSALAGQGAWHGGAGLVGRELGSDVWVVLRVRLRKGVQDSLSSLCSKSPGPNPGTACGAGWWRNTAVPGDTAPLSALHRAQGTNGSFHGANLTLAKIPAAAGAAPALPSKARAEPGRGGMGRFLINVLKLQA